MIPKYKCPSCKKDSAWRIKEDEDLYAVSRKLIFCDSCGSRLNVKIRSVSYVTLVEEE